MNEYGPNTGEPKPTVKVDFAAKDLAELAESSGVKVRSLSGGSMPRGAAVSATSGFDA